MGALLCGLINCFFFGWGTIIDGLFAQQLSTVCIGILQCIIPFVGTVSRCMCRQCVCVVASAQWMCARLDLEHYLGHLVLCPSTVPVMLQETQLQGHETRWGSALAKPTTAGRLWCTGLEFVAAGLSWCTSLQQRNSPYSIEPHTAHHCSGIQTEKHKALEATAGVCTVRSLR